MLGRIVILKEPNLNQGSKSWQLMEKVLYEVLQLDPKNIDVFNMTLAFDAGLKIEADVIIAVGDTVLQDLCGIKGIMKYAGTVQKYKDIPVVPIVSPGYIEHNPNYMRQWAEHLQLAYNISIGIEQKEATNQFIIVEDLDTLRNLVQYCKETGYASFDFETTELTDLGTFDPNFQVNTLAISFQPGSAYVIPLSHTESAFRTRISEVIPILQEIFSDPTITKVAQNMKFDLHCAAYLGITEFRGPVHDTLAMHQLIEESLPHGLKPMVREYYMKFANYEDSLGKNWNAPLPQLAQYNALDADLTLRLYFIFTNILLENPEIYLMFRNLTAPATKTLFEMEERGMLCDKRHLIESIRKVDEMIEKQELSMRDHYEFTRFMHFKKEEAKENTIADLEEKWNKLQPQEFKSKAAQENKVKRLAEIDQTLQDLKTGVKEVETPEFNFSSHVQLKELLFSKEGFGFVVPKQDYKKLPENSTNADNISLIKDKTGFIEDLQTYRQLKLIRSTYLTGILEKMDNNHYVHTSFNQAVTKTGRLSAKNPNLQNIITRTKFKVVEEAVALVKQAFIPPADHTLYQADFSQIELRVLAAYAQEREMLKIYGNDDDIHSMTAANSHGYTVEEFNTLKETDPALHKKLRFQAKAENFGYCLHPDTEVVTKRGLVPIKDVTTEDIVLTHKNNWEPVLQKQVLRSEYLYEITTTTGKTVKCTPDHMWLCNFPQANGNPSMSGWVEAQDLKENMFLSYNTNGYPWGTLHLDPTIALILGWFLSEGNLGTSGFKITQSRKANPDICAKMDKYLFPFGFTYRCYDSTMYYHCPMKIYRAKLEGLINFKFLSKDKTFKHLRTQLDRESMLLMLGALWDGDGCIVYRKRTNYNVQISYCSISVPLLEDIQYCLHSLGINSKIYCYPKVRANVLQIVGIEGKMKFLAIVPTAKVHRFTYETKLGTTNWSCEEKIVAINKIAYNAEVYDITVANDHSFVANNLFTHNCYGMSANGFKEYARTDYNMDISLKDAERRREAYFKKYPELLKYHRLYIDKARKFKYVRTFFGRRVHLPDIDSINSGVRGHAERNAINSPIQGTAGEMTIFALSLLNNRLPKEVLVVNSIHDSIMFYIPNGMEDEALPIIQNTMENLPLHEYFGKSIHSVPIKIEFEKSTESWGKLK